MDKKLAGLVGVMGALAVATPGHAATPNLDDAMRADTYADLLRPIPNASVLLAKSNAVAMETQTRAPELLEVQYYRHHHHHHHHHRYVRPFFPVGRGYYRHHHHHHHHHGPGFGIFIR